MNVQTQPKSILDNPTVIKRAIIYARVSTDEQAETGTSIDNQVEKSLIYAASKGMRVIADPFKEDYTGKVLDRPELNKVRAMLKAGQADCLIVYKTNRLDRSEWGVNLLILLQELKSLGVELHYSRDKKQVNLNDPVEALMQSISGWQAGEDHRETVTKLLEGRYTKVRQGNVMLSQVPPLGYKKAKVNGKSTLQIVPEEAKIIELIFFWYVVEGLTLWAIADRLIENGIPSPSDRGKAAKTRQNNKRVWNTSTLAGIIRNETYTGVWRFAKTLIVNGKRVKNTLQDDTLIVSVPAIISREIWEAGQVRLQQNKENAKRNRKHEYLLSGRCICKCGYKLGGRTRDKYSYYCCPSGNGKYLTRDCDMPFFRADRVEAVVWRWIEEVLTDEVKLQLAIDDYRAMMEKQNNPAKEELTIVEGLIAENREKLADEMLNMRLVKGEMAKAEFAVAINRIEETLTRLTTRRNELIAQIEDTTLTDAQILTIKQFAAQVRTDIETIRADFDSKRAFLDLINLQARFTIEDGVKMVYVTCKIGNPHLSIVSIAPRHNF